VRTHFYNLIPTEVQHRKAMGRLRPFRRCMFDVGRAGWDRVKPVSCFGPGNLLRWQAGARWQAAARDGKRRETFGRDILQRVTALCTITDALAVAASAAEGLLCAGERDEVGGLVVDEAEAMKVRAGIAWAQDLARAKQGEMESQNLRQQ
jgi:hypothetical protein